LSDGTLRFIALAKLLLQPPELLPVVIVIDEPELGLHPAALNLLCGMLSAVSHHCQVVVGHNRRHNGWLRLRRCGGESVRRRLTFDD
jgi:predicted ATPase